jgi:hypothetical protein
MRESNYDTYLKIYTDIGDLQPELQTRRFEILKHLPFSVVAEGAYPELDMADQWLLKQVGHESETSWQKIWYGKIAYDYGFTEYFFEDEPTQPKFADEIPHFYGEGPNGKWKTDGQENYVSLE